MAQFYYVLLSTRQFVTEQTATSKLNLASSDQRVRCGVNVFVAAAAIATALCIAVAIATALCIAVAIATALCIDVDIATAL